MAITGKNGRGYVAGLFTLLAFLAFSSQAFALNTTANRSSLKGLLGVKILVEEFSPEIEKSGLTKSKLETEVETRLKKEGIAVLTQEEVLKTPGEPYLYINVNAAAGKTQSNFFSYSIDIALIQNIFLERDPKANTYAITWSTGGVGLMEKESLSGISESLLDIIDVFVEAYQSVNKN